MDREVLTQQVIEDLSRCQRLSAPGAWSNLGLSHAQVGMLYMLSYHHDASVKDIGQYLGTTKSAVSQLIDPLLSKKLVSRRSDPQDKRIARLSLTSSGTKILKKVNKYKFAGLRSALSGLNDVELKQLYKLCQKLAAETKKEIDND